MGNTCLSRKKNKKLRYKSINNKRKKLNVKELALNQYEPAKKIDILFRNSVLDIPSTTYGTFSIYKYPAKFIPQVIAYVLKEYAKPGMKIFDPFAGCGTTGIVSRVYGYDYELWDLNPMLNLLHNVATINKVSINPSEIIEEIKNSKKEFLPKWSNCNYWFPQEFLPMLSKSWGYVHSLPDKLKSILSIPLIKVTRYFSYSDEKVHKLYKSKFSTKKINNLLLNDNWEKKFYNMLEREINLLVKKVNEHRTLNSKGVDSKIKTGIDVLETKLEDNADILITSPPYLQAQEYIRSTKLELFWLGYDERYIKSLSKMEIPYIKPNGYNVLSSTYNRFRNDIKEDHLKELYDSYFQSILKSFTTLGEKVNKYMCIFVGPAKIRTTSIPIDEIVVEHLSHFGWEHKVTLIDKIVARSMFASKVNPASGLKDERMQTENLVVLKRRK